VTFVYTLNVDIDIYLLECYIIVIVPSLVHRRGRLCFQTPPVCTRPILRSYWTIRFMLADQFRFSARPPTVARRVFIYCSAATSRTLFIHQTTHRPPLLSYPACHVFMHCLPVASCLLFIHCPAASLRCTQIHPYTLSRYTN